MNCIMVAQYHNKVSKDTTTKVYEDIKVIRMRSPKSMLQLQLQSQCYNYHPNNYNYNYNHNYHPNTYHHSLQMMASGILLSSFFRVKNPLCNAGLTKTALTNSSAKNKLPAIIEITIQSQIPNGTV